MLHRGRFIALALPVAFVASTTWFGIFTLVNAYVVKGLGHSDATWATVDLALTIGMVVWQFFCTEAARGIGRRRAMTIAMVVAGVSFALIGVTSNLWVIGGLLAMMGLFQSLTSCVFVPMLADAAGDRPGRAIALYQLLITVTTVVVVVGGGYFVEHSHYAGLFMVIGGVAVACAFIFDRAATAVPANPSHEIIGLLRLTGGDLRAMFGGPFLAVLVFGLCAEPFYYHMINHLLPNLARETPYNLSEQTITSMVAFCRLPSLLTTFLMAHYIDRVNPVRWYSVGMACSATLAIALTRTPSAAWLVGVYLAYFLFHGFVWGSNCATANASVPKRLRESAFAVLALLQTGTAALAGVLHQRLLSRGYTIPDVYAISGTVALAGAAMLFLYSWRWRAAAEAANE